MKRPSFFEHLHPPSIPEAQARFRYTLGLGGLSVFLFVVVALTGALLLFYYSPSVEQANASIQLLQYHVPLGWLVRGLHFWSAQALVVTAALHLLRVALTGGFRAGRRFNWLLGLALLVLVLGLDFTGYGLRWDASIGWALLVGTNLLRLLPLAGETLYRWLVGAPELGAATVLRLYGWHIFGLMLPAIAIAVWHLFRVRRDGGIAHDPAAYHEKLEGRPRDAPATEDARLPRSVLVRREVVAMLVAAGALLALSSLAAPALDGPLDPSAMSAEAHAPWFFLAVQELLRWGNPLVFGVFLPIVALLVLALLPYAFDRGATLGRWLPRDGRSTQVVVLALALAVGLLTLRGAWR
ncbi:MAG TPA: cytochrome b N-terminal domain-containing protein [Anaerolineales bacterium]|nr:cytochrome b N-terminal domain-containing protein [Anaerolineales bacterium]